MLTIIVYHYVRDLPNTDFAEIKGLLTAEFEGQLDYIERHYTVIDIQDVMRTIKGEKNLPSNACLLTFDDGLFDHYETVFPRLVKRGLSGSFYPSAMPILEHQVLDVHKIHFILASGNNVTEIKNALFEAIEPFRKTTSLPSNNELYDKYAQASLYDKPDVEFIKRMLQVALPEHIRSAITDTLFYQYVTDDEATFAKMLYLDAAQLKEMIAAGMTVGGHGFKHNWLGTLSRNEQKAEINATLGFLEQIYNKRLPEWIMCYPKGSYNNDTLELLSISNCKLGLTINVDLSDTSKPLELSRLDTNDLPVDKDAPPCSWTHKINDNI